MRTVDGVQILTEQEKQQLIVHTLAERESIDVFIETGTYQGDMVAAVLPYVRRIYTIELHVDRHQECHARFAGVNPHSLVLIQGDSATALPWVLERVDEPALIWLDAHHSDADSAGTHNTCPLREELRACLASPFDHVIYCDDARFLGRGNWPTLAEIHEMAAGWNVSVADDIVRVTR